MADQINVVSLSNLSDIIEKVHIDTVAYAEPSDDGTSFTVRQATNLRDLYRISYEDIAMTAGKHRPGEEGKKLQDWYRDHQAAIARRMWWIGCFGANHSGQEHFSRKAKWEEWADSIGSGKTPASGGVETLIKSVKHIREKLEKSKMACGYRYVQLLLAIEAQKEFITPLGQEKIRQIIGSIQFVVKYKREAWMPRLMKEHINLRWANWDKDNIIKVFQTSPVWANCFTNGQTTGIESENEDTVGQVMMKVQATVVSKWADKCDYPVIVGTLWQQLTKEQQTEKSIKDILADVDAILGHAAQPKLQLEVLKAQLESKNKAMEQAREEAKEAQEKIKSLTRELEEAKEAEQERSRELAEMTKLKVEARADVIALETKVNQLKSDAQLAAHPVNTDTTRKLWTIKYWKDILDLESGDKLTWKGVLAVPVILTGMLLEWLVRMAATATGGLIYAPVHIWNWFTKKGD